MPDMQPPILAQFPPMNDYEETCRTFNVKVPERFNWVREVVDFWAQDRTKLALISVSRDGSRAEKFSFFDLSRLSNRFANALLSLGLKKGDHAFVMLPRVPEWHIAMLGMLKVGIVPMPATTMCTARDVAFRMERGEAVAAITDCENAAKVDEAAPRAPHLKHRIAVGGGPTSAWRTFASLVDGASPKTPDSPPTLADDPLLVFFTSGTVGPPKMVLHSNARYVLGQIGTGRYWHALKPTDLHWTISDTGWAKAIFGKLFGQMTTGATLLEHDAGSRFDPALALSLIEKFGVTSFCAPPTGFRMLVLEDLKKYDLTSLRHCTSAGEPLNPEVIKIWQDGTGLAIYDGYGQSETTLTVANFPCNPIRQGSMGKPWPGMTIALLDEDLKEVEVGQEGEIALRVRPERPLGLFRGYWKDPETTARVFQGDWYLTGDLATRDKDGYIWFVGRADDVIKASGYRIGPFEVESALIEHPAVAESAVVGSPDPVRGLVVKAFVVLRPGYKPSDALVKELQEHVKRTTAPYKYPRIVEFVPDLPKTVSGKIRRKELREREREKAKNQQPQAVAA